VTLDSAVAYDRDKLAAAVETLATTIDQSPVDASVSAGQGGTFSVSSAKGGRAVDKAALLTALMAAATSGCNGRNSVLGPQYEYKEDLTLSLDGSATLVNGRAGYMRSLIIDKQSARLNDALHRNESCGGHFRTEFQTSDGEAQRDDNGSDGDDH
jgi:hypothetical protein